MKEEKLDHFLSFITSTHIIQDLPFGEKTLRLSSHEELKIPNVVRSQIPRRICTNEPQHLIESIECLLSLYLQSLQGLEYFSASGAEAFDELQKVVDKLVDECGKNLTWGKDVNDKLKHAKRYLKGDCKVICYKVNLR